MRVRNKRVLKNGVLAGYVLQKDGTWKFRFLKGKRKKQRGGNALDWHLKEKDKTLIRNNLHEIKDKDLKNLKNEEEQEKLKEKLKFLEELNIFAVLNFIASDDEVRNLIRSIFRRGFGIVGLIIKKKFIKKIKEKNITQNPNLINAAYFFIKGFGSKVKENLEEQMIDLIVSRKSYKSLEDTKEFKEIRNKNKKTGGPAHIFTNARNVNNNLQTQPNPNENEAIRQIQRIYRGKKGRNTARNLKRKNTANTIRTNNIGNAPSFQHRNFKLQEYNRMKKKLRGNNRINRSC